jgi:hypothetical protein
LTKVLDEFVTFFLELKWKFSLQPFLKEAEVGRLGEVNLNDSKGPTEATEPALHEAQLEDALPTEVKLAAGKPIFSRPNRHSGEVFFALYILKVLSSGN